MRIGFSSLKNKLILSYVSITLLSLVMVFAIFYVFIDRYADQKEEEALQASAEQVAVELVKFIGREPALQELELFLESIESLQGVDVDVVTGSGRSLFDIYEGGVQVETSSSIPISEVMELMMRMSLSGTQGRGRYDMHSARLPVGVAGSTGYRGGIPSVQSVFSLADARTELLVNGNPVESFIVIDEAPLVRSSIMRPAMVSFATASAIALVLSALLGWAMGRKLARPLQALSVSVSGMGSGDLSTRAGPDECRRSDEIGLLAGQFNRMAEALQDTVHDLQAERDTLRNFLSDASHELRTPLTALISYLELLQSPKNRPADLDAGNPKDRNSGSFIYLSRSMEQAQRIRGIVTNLLELSRLEGRQDDKRMLSIERCSIRELLNQAVEAVLSTEEGQGIRIDIRRSREAESMPLLCDREVMRSVLENVLGNSVKFSHANHSNPADIAVEVRAEVERGILVIRVTDNGPGIPPAELTRVFDRFYRGASVQAPGSGIGLAIVKTGVELHRGTATVSNRADGKNGTVTEIRLPLGIEVS
jgi:signal transduction histidine kinase